MERFSDYINTIDERTNRLSRRRVVNEFLKDEREIKNRVDRISNTNVKYVMERLIDLVFVLLIDFRKKGKI